MRNTVYAMLFAGGLVSQFYGVSAIAADSAQVAKTPATVQLIAAPTTTIEIVFVLDTTGSMGGLIEGAKSKIWSIVNDVMQKRGGAQGVHVRVGLVAYRDRGDEYITQVSPLTDNLDTVYAQLMTYRAAGGGDTPEDVRSALRDAVQKAGWSANDGHTSQIIFLVGDAPPHNEYQDVPATTVTAAAAHKNGILINTIQCGNIEGTAAAWRSVAQEGGGEFFSIAQDGGVAVIATPYDDELAALGHQIGDTYMAYGTGSVRAAKKTAQASMESSMALSAPSVAKADRAVNKAINAQAFDENDLLQQIESGKQSLAKIKEADLPDTLQALKPSERQAQVDKELAERKAIRAHILALSKQRDQYLAEQRSKQVNNKQGFDAAVSAALAKQIK